ncbi:MAG: hypothetical protein ACE5EO_07210 [Candidatus Krumholzibacteriia bacterium]
MSPILWILIIAFTSQGTLPGVVMCVEPAGKVEYEALADKCCFGTTKPATESTVVLGTASPASERGNSCGPCTDSLISPAPVTRPAKNGDVSVAALGSARLPFNPISIETEILSVTRYVAKDAALIPIKTTILRI